MDAVTSSNTPSNKERLQILMSHPQKLVDEVNDVFHVGFEIPKEKLVPEATLFGDLELDSLDAVDMLVHLEEKLDLRVDGDRLKDIKTLNDIYTMVQTLIAAELQPAVSLENSTTNTSSPQL